VNSISTLWIGAVFTTLLVMLIFLPKIGLLSLWRNQQHMNQRQVLEDALKIIFNAQQEGRLPDHYRLAVELRLDINAVRAFISRLVAQGLVQINQGRLSLTDEGQRWALQVIRAHRLWERYLADEARMPLEHIHTVAHQREHQMSVEEIDRLDASLGYPSEDPHGDPIPNSVGVLRNTQIRTPLVNLSVGQRGKIIHLEDEPPLVYAQLLEEGLYMGQMITLLESSQAQVVIGDGERQYVLAPSSAENIYILLDSPKEMQDPDEASNPEVIPLGNLPPMTKAEIVDIDERCQGFTRRRFLDLGLTPGTPIYPELENLFKDPRAYRVRGTLVALRRDQAAWIWVRPIPTAFQTN